MKKVYGIGIIAGVIGAGVIIKKAFDCGFKTASIISLLYSPERSKADEQIFNKPQQMAERIYYAKSSRFSHIQQVL